MRDSPGQPRPRTTVEDLLRLKRAERPDPAFWQDFEHGLRQKQLAAIVEPRPWWLGLSLLTRKIPTPAWFFASASAGAAALFALTTITSGPDAPKSGFPGQVAAVSSSHPAASLKSSAAVSSPLSGPGSETAPALSVASASRPPTFVDSRGDASIDLAFSTPDTLRLAMAGIADAATVADNTVTPSPAALAEATEPASGLVSSTLAAKTVAPMVINAGLDADFPPLAVTAVSLANSASESANDLVSDARAVNPRHARLLAAPEASEDSKKTLANARERVVHRLSGGDELYASITRVGVSGDRLSLRF